MPMTGELRTVNDQTAQRPPSGEGRANAPAPIALCDHPPAKPRQSAMCAVLWLVSSCFLLLGLNRPVIEIAVNIESVLKEAIDQQPVVGLLLQERGFRLSEIASRLPPSTVTRHSVVSSAMKLFQAHSYMAATLILLFSIIVPICKQLVFALSLCLSDARSASSLKLAQRIHKWAMLDVFVLAMVVLALSSAASWTAVLLEGFFWFLAYFFTASVLGMFLSRRTLHTITH